MVTFHRVGQGLFASETFENHTIVYDCGGENADIVRNALDSDFDQPQEIDVLFISHYDRDHINGIFHLLERHKVRHVILPLVSDFSRFLSFDNNIDDIQSNGLQQFYSNPAQFFRNNYQRTLFHYLRDANVGFGSSIPLNIDGLPSKLDSCVHILLINNWLLIPYNRKVMTKQEEKELMLKLGLKPNLGFKQILQKWPRIPSTLKNALIGTGTINRKNINDYSMTLYSQNKESITLYLGDYNAKDHCDKLQTVYGGFWKEISCVQVPHHGSEKSFNDELLECGANDYVISNTREPTSSKKVDPRPVIDIIKQHKKKPHITDKCKIELKQTPKAT